MKLRDQKMPDWPKINVDYCFNGFFQIFEETLTKNGNKNYFVVICAAFTWTLSKKEQNWDKVQLFEFWWNA